MCGIAGILNIRKEPINPYIIKDMCDVIAHRGPDDAGYTLFSFDGVSPGKNLWFELTDNDFKHKNAHLAPIESHYAHQEIEGKKWHLALGHRRLAIIDLSPKGHQPMSEAGKSYWIVYNGEVYNFKELRTELEKLGHKFYSTSDTEVILHAYQEWGIDCIMKFNGMFAFCLWDNEKNKFFLVRDRYGIKPVYYYFNNGVFIFASEIKSILKNAFVKVELNYEALNEYFTFQNIFTDNTLFKDITLLPAGSYIEIDIDKADVKRHKYWDYNFSSSSTLSQEETIEQLYVLFVQAVNRQLVSDVPVGSYLSGGMDTGSITSIAGKHFGRIFTFTVGFDLTSASGLELSFDERKHSEILANLLKTEHYEVVLHAGDMEEIMPDLIWHLEDIRLGQCYPNYYGARLAGKFVKVVLSGGGGDELFGGYPWRYYHAIGSSNKEQFLQNYYNYWQRLVKDGEKKVFFAQTVQNTLKAHSTFDIFRKVFNQKDMSVQTEQDCINNSLYFEIKTFLHGLFVVEDKISMSHSLETRVPFLDNDLVNFAMQIPPIYKLGDIKKVIKVDEDKLLDKYQIKSHEGKAILRKTMQKLIPSEIVYKGKIGFSAPDASWFRGESINYIQFLLLNKNAGIYNYLNYDFVQNKIDEHTSGKINHRLFIWSLLSFEWWLRRFLG